MASCFSAVPLPHKDSVGESYHCASFKYEHFSSQAGQSIRQHYLHLIHPPSISLTYTKYPSLFYPFDSI